MRIFFLIVKLEILKLRQFDFALDEILTSDKRFVIVEAGTGVGKSAVGLTVARYLNENMQSVDGFGRWILFCNNSKNSSRSVC